MNSSGSQDGDGLGRQRNSHQCAKAKPLPINTGRQHSRGSADCLWWQLRHTDKKSRRHRDDLGNGVPCQGSGLEGNTTLFQRRSRKVCLTGPDEWRGRSLSWPGHRDAKRGRLPRNRRHLCGAAGASENQTCNSPFPLRGRGEVRDLKHLGLGLRGKRRAQTLSRGSLTWPAEPCDRCAQGTGLTSLSAAILRSGASGRAQGLPGKMDPGGGYWVPMGGTSVRSGCGLGAGPTTEDSVHFLQAGSS